LDTYLKQAVARALAKVIDGNEAILIVEEASDRRFLENLVYLIKDRYQGESMKILRRLEEALEIRDPTLAEKLRRAYKR
jgi:hypothetical protein